MTEKRIKAITENDLMAELQKRGIPKSINGRWQTWQENDVMLGPPKATMGGIYFLRQVDDFLWWAGFSTDSPRGVTTFTSV
jgi:hypothetical protein